MSGAVMALIAEEQLYFIPRDLQTERRINDEEAIERFGRGASGEGDAESVFLARGDHGGLNEFLRGAFCDGRSIRQDSNLTIHTRSSQVMIPALSGAAIRPRLSISSSPIRRQDRKSTRLNSSHGYI